MHSCSNSHSQTAPHEKDCGAAGSDLVISGAIFNCTLLCELIGKQCDFGNGEDGQGVSKCQFSHDADSYLDL
jgi:hypothetical protein